MKARNFRYIRPSSLAHAYRILADTGPDAVPLAGGQSLLPGLNMRLSAPKLLVDIGDLEELTGLSEHNGAIRIGALTRHRELLRTALIRERLPLLSQAAAHIGHIGVRNRGTLGGSLSYADPAAELPACCVVLGASLVIGSAAGTRRVKAEDFFTGVFETALAAGELVLAVEFPPSSPNAVFGFAELARRRGDFAIVGLAASAKRDGDRIGDARIAYFGCVERARLAHSVSEAVEELSPSLNDARSFTSAIQRDLSPDDSPEMRADTKLHLAQVLTRRVLNSLAGRAK